jgi:hypothetical protein
MRREPKAGGDDLDARIALAEFAVIQRDERIRRRAGSLATRVKADVARHAGTTVAVGAGLAVFVWWLRRGRRAHGDEAVPPAPAMGPPEPGWWEILARELGLSLTSVLPLLWPYVPRAVRRVVNPQTAGAVLSFLAPLAARVFRRRPRRPA